LERISKNLIELDSGGWNIGICVALAEAMNISMDVIGNMAGKYSNQNLGKEGKLLKTKFRSIKSFIILMIVLLAFAGSNEAVMIKLSLEDLSFGSEAIILGEIEDIQCHWSMDQSAIMTIVMLKIHERLKGDLPYDHIFIQFPGGEIGDLGLRVSDTPEFQPKEKVLVFLSAIRNVKDPKNSLVVVLNFVPSYRVFGSAQGKYSVDQDGIASKRGYDLMIDDPDSDKILPLEELKSRIRNILQKQPKKREKTREKIKY
jgi:hypothetical protein